MYVVVVVQRTFATDLSSFPRAIVMEEIPSVKPITGSAAAPISTHIRMHECMYVCMCVCVCV